MTDGGFDTTELPWTSDSVEVRIGALIPDLTTPASAVEQILSVLNELGYDSVDREKAFALACERHGWSYDDLYEIWLHPMAEGDDS